ncbi:MAG: hypothetical protein H6R01_869 [Burkholderiaceae bacterium]|nr:hypothetical protein [Burkholderiaceae bacterium]
MFDFTRAGWFYGYHSRMTKETYTEADALRMEIAVAAAKLIAEEGLSYATAKRKAARQVLGEGRVSHDVLPGNALIEEEVRIYNELFLSDSQPARLRRLRQLALEVMEELAQFDPYLTGAVLNGTAGEHSDIYLQLFADNPKEVEMFLLNRNVNFDVSETPHFRPHRPPVETLSFLREGEGVHLALYSHDDLRGAVRARDERRLERANLEMVRSLVAEDER